MSSLLLDEPPLVVIPSLAVAFGLSEAIVLQQVHYWCLRSEHEHDGRRWTHQTMSQWREQFPFWSEDTIKRTCKKLKETGLIEVRKLAGAMRGDSTDRTNWYTINYAKIGSVEHRAESPLPTGQIALMEQGRLPSCSKQRLRTESESVDQLPLDDPRTQPKAKKVTYRGAPVPADVVAVAESVLAHFVKATGRRSMAAYSAQGKPTASMTQVMGALLANPDATEAEWKRAITNTVANPPDWVGGDGRIRLGHVFGERASEWALSNGGGAGGVDEGGEQKVSGFELRRQRRAEEGWG